MDRAHPLSTPMVVMSLDISKDPFRPCENDEELVAAEIPYLSAIGTLLYLANNSRPGVAFSLSDPHKGQSQTGYLFTCGEIIAIHEASRECVWLRSMTQHIQKTCGLTFEGDIPTTLYEDNAGEIDVRQVRSSDNLADMFTKAIPTLTFEKLIYKIGMRRLRDIK
ncbi:uncharacterized protein LOC132041790 [Lycium ferocissimum]|uniref:uncharacterized protein LOC132041790 n=1 Tax=Lycium ferocissimum TaxID=112874 RepID=UPI002814DA4A|nr:uncharacterized protein LOC132041790 [Lycium ferocissimum]